LYLGPEWNTDYGDGEQAMAMMQVNDLFDLDIIELVSIIISSCIYAWFVH
jgi:hypothetical protein